MSALLAPPLLLASPGFAGPVRTDRAHLRGSVTDIVNINFDVYVFIALPPPGRLGNCHGQICLGVAANAQ